MDTDKPKLFTHFILPLVTFVLPLWLTLLNTCPSFMCSDFADLPDILIYMSYTGLGWLLFFSIIIGYLVYRKKHNINIAYVLISIMLLPILHIVPDKIIWIIFAFTLAIQEWLYAIVFLLIAGALAFCISTSLRLAINYRVPFNLENNIVVRKYKWLILVVLTPISAWLVWKAIHIYVIFYLYF